MSNVHPISKDDIRGLLDRLRIELFRRSGWDKDGNPIHDEMFRHYNQPVFTSPEDAFADDKFFNKTIRELLGLDTNESDDEFLDLSISEAIKLADSDIINAYQGHTLIEAIISICDFEDLRRVKEFDLIPGAFDKSEIEKFITTLEADEFSTKTPHCRSACTGLCMNACTDTCIGACVGVCASCSVNCVGGCHSGCEGCSSSCGTTCGVSCGTGCSGKATGCVSCYSACSGCVSCTDSCSTGCTGCANQCTSCLAGCQGASGYNNTCGCGSTCTTGCGGKVSSVATGSAMYALKFYHDRKIYGAKRSTPDTGTVVMPDIIDYDNIFTPCSVQAKWVDENGDMFVPGQSVRTASTLTTYNNLKSSGIVVTRGHKFKSVVVRNAAELCPKVSVVSPNLTESMKNEFYSNGDFLYLPYASTIYIESTDGFTGLSTSDKGVMIDSKHVVLPYHYHHQKDTKITFIGGRFNISYRAYPVIKYKIDISDNPSSYFVPYAETRMLGSNQYNMCEYCNNPHVGVYIDDTRIDGSMPASAKQIKITAESLCDIHADGSYGGYMFKVSLEEFRLPLSSPNIYLDGETDSLHNAFVTVSADSLDIKYKIPLVQEMGGVNSDMMSVWECNIPSRETIGFDSSVECLMLPSCDDRPMQKIPFGSRLNIHTRQDFYLLPYIPQESGV